MSVYSMYTGKIKGILNVAWKESVLILFTVYLVNNDPWFSFGMKFVFRTLSDRVFRGRVEKTDPRSADYPLTPIPRTSLRTTPRITLRTTLKKKPNLRLRGKETQEAYMLHLYDHNCMKNSLFFISPHSSSATYQNPVF